MTRPLPPCPFCGSEETLPFEKEEDYLEEYSPEVAVYAGITLVSLLLGLLIFSVIYFRVLVVAAGIVAAYLYRHRRKRRPPRGSFVCLGCSRSFRR